MKNSFYLFLFFYLSHFLAHSQTSNYISLTSSVGKSKVKLFDKDPIFEFCGVGLPDRFINQKINNGHYSSMGITYSKGFDYFSISAAFELEGINYSVNSEGITTNAKMNRISLPIFFTIESPKNFGPFASLGVSPKWNYKTVSNLNYYSNDSRATINIINSIGIKYSLNSLNFKVGYSYQKELKNDSYRLGFNHVVLREDGYKMLGSRLNSSSLFISVGYEI